MADESLRRRLDDAADAVVRDLERGALEAAWARTRELEQEAGGAAEPTPEPVPSAPVIGRRFAAAHRRMLFDPPGVGCAGAVVCTHPAA